MRVYWDSATSTYRTLDGRTVKDSAVRAALDLVLDAQAVQMRDLTQRLIDGTLALALWQAQMMQAIKLVHLVGTAAAAGGWAQMDPVWNGWAGSQIKPQYAWLVRFTVEISSGRQRLDGTALSRSALYASAARTTHRSAIERLIRVRMIAGEEKSNLGLADHCRLCIQEAKRGWQPFGVLIAIGKRTCLSNCRCWFTYRPTPAV